ncbi:MAG: transaldolase family protein [Cloacibacillus evryensis]
MKFFLDTANLEEVKAACSWGVIAGVTTNPTLVSKEGNIDFHTRVREIAEAVNGPVSAEAVSGERQTDRRGKGDRQDPSAGRRQGAALS